jgi:hypothetical protein
MEWTRGRTADCQFCHLSTTFLNNSSRYALTLLCPTNAACPLLICPSRTVTKPVPNSSHAFSDVCLFPISKVCCQSVVGRDSSVGIATRYGLDFPGIDSRRGGEIFRTRPDRLWGPPSLLYNGYRIFPGSKAAGAWRWSPTPI